jgi:hypothetical protein
MIPRAEGIVKVAGGRVGRWRVGKGCKGPVDEAGGVAGREQGADRATAYDRAVEEGSPVEVGRSLGGGLAGCCPASTGC